jgi:predicted transcriptional regulator
MANMKPKGKITACVDAAIRALAALGLNQSEIGRIIGFTPSAVSYHLANRRKSPLLGVETAASVEILRRAHEMAVRRLAEDQLFVEDCVKSAMDAKKQ